MKTILCTLWLILSVAKTNGQTFFKSFEGVIEADQNKVFVQNDGFIITGFGFIQDKYQLYVMKVNLTGEIVWTKYHEITGYSGENYRCYSSAIDPEGNMYLGLLYSLIKLTPEGEIAYHNISEATYFDLLWHESGELIASAQWQPSSHRIFRIDPSNCTIIEQSTSIQGTNLIGTSLAIDDENNIVLSLSEGFDYTAPAASNLYVFQNLNLQSFDVIPLQYEESVVHRTTIWSDGSYVAVGHEGQYATTDNVSYLTRFQKDGSVSQENAATFPYRFARLYKYVFNNQGNVVALGEVQKNSESNKQILLHCMSNEGDSIWTTFYGTSDITKPYDIRMAPDGGYVIAGTTDFNNTQVPCIIKTNSVGQLTPLGLEQKPVFEMVNVYPNPANGILTFEAHGIDAGTIIISNVIGQKCLETKLNGIKTIVPTGDLKPGLYIYLIRTDKFTKTGKIQVQ
ncbi:MAG TPA: T9SS type A sorting domain-containing protein [Lentimicrobium sp.]|nr:T9SS type A sorting domain-containing protein [Lentimicrobium sp.]